MREVISGDVLGLAVIAYGERRMARCSKSVLFAQQAGKFGCASCGEVVGVEKVLFAELRGSTEVENKRAGHVPELIKRGSHAVLQPSGQRLAIKGVYGRVDQHES